MATSAVDPRIDSTEILFMGSKSIIEEIKGSSIIFFAQMLQLIKYVADHVHLVDRFTIIVPSTCLDELLKNTIYLFGQVRQVYVCYENDNDRIQDEDRLKQEHKKLRFCHKRNLLGLIQNLKMGTASSASEPNYQATVDDVTLSVDERISAKRSNPAAHCSTTPKRFASSPKHGFSVKNIEQVDACYICPSCRLLFRGPHQLECGDRICKSCIRTDKNHTICSACGHVSVNECIRFDRGFSQDMLHLSISCSSCDWTGNFQNYQNHIDQKHSDEESNVVIRDVYSQQPDQHRIHEPVYTNATHEHTSLNIPTASRSIHMTNNSNSIGAQCQMLCNHFRQMIATLSKRADNISNELQRIGTKIRRIYTLCGTVEQNIYSIKASLEVTDGNINNMKLTHELLTQQIWSLKQAVHNALLTSYNGTYIWKIAGVHEKIVDAESERQRSIFSPPFYSSGNGYKMCLRLYLNGDGSTRGKYLSLYIVLMKNEYDAILTWPFPYSIKLRLINLSASNDNERDVIHVVRPNVTSGCFQRPNFDMNDGHGVKEFLSVENFKENLHQFVEDDAMYIEAKIDFTNEDSSITSSLCGSPDDEEHVGTINENLI